MFLFFFTTAALAATAHLDPDESFNPCYYDTDDGSCVSTATAHDLGLSLLNVPVMASYGAVIMDWISLQNGKCAELAREECSSALSDPLPADVASALATTVREPLPVTDHEVAVGSRFGDIASSLDQLDLTMLNMMDHVTRFTPPPVTLVEEMVENFRAVVENPEVGALVEEILVHEQEGQGLRSLFADVHSMMQTHSNTEIAEEITKNMASFFLPAASDQECQGEACSAEPIAPEDILP
jgi:hypothetical protein